MNFKATARLLACLLLARGGLIIAAASPDSSEDVSNPYAVISERNVFHLNPIPPPPPPDAPKVELPEIKLSGFLKIGHTTHALFSYTPKDKKDEPVYYDLVDGEKEGILEVVKIHEDKGEVEVLNSGTAATLTLKDDTLEPKETAAITSKEGNPPSEHPRFPERPAGMPGHSADRPSWGHQSANPLAFPIPQRRTRPQQ